MEESTPELAATRYRRVIEGYKSRLRTNPDLKLSEYCKESHTNYRGVIDWTKRHGISILELRREARGETSGSTSAPQERRHGLLRALVGDVQLHNVRHLVGKRVLP